MEKPRTAVSGQTLLAAAAMALVFLHFVRHILLPFVLAAGVAYLLAPLIRWIEARLRMPRLMAALAVYFIVVAVLGAAVWFGGAAACANAAEFTQKMPERLHQALARTFGGEQITFFGVTFTAQGFAESVAKDFRGFLGSPAGVLQFGAGLIFGTVLSLVLLFYFVVRGPELALGMLNLAPPEQRSRVRELARRADPLLQRYLWGLFTVVLTTAFLAWIGVGLVFHLPQAVLLSLATGVLELIPILGPAASAILLGGTAIAHGGTAWTFLGFAIFCTCLRLLIDQVIGPLVLGQAVKLPPVVILFAFLAGGALLGIAGMLIAIPAAATCNIMLNTYYVMPVRKDESHNG